MRKKINKRLLGLISLTLALLIIILPPFISIVQAGAILDLKELNVLIPIGGPQAVAEGERYIRARTSLLIRLAERSPSSIMMAMVSFEELLGPEEVEVTLKGYDVMILEGIGYNPVTGSTYGFGIEEGSLVKGFGKANELLRGLVNAMMKEMEKAKDIDEKERYRMGLELLLEELKLRESHAKVAGVIIKGRLEELRRLLNEKDVLLVDLAFHEQEWLIKLYGLKVKYSLMPITPGYGEAHQNLRIG